MNKVDKKVKEYLERATKIVDSEGDFYSESCGRLFPVGDLVEVAKMIQREEHFQNREVIEGEK